MKGFGKTAQQIAAVLNQEKISFSWIGDGIYVVFNDELIPDEEAMTYEYQFRQLLQHKPTD